MLDDLTLSDVAAWLLRLVVKTTPSQQWRAEDGIEIPFPQPTVWHEASA